jgi:hypothetical protein
MPGGGLGEPGGPPAEAVDSRFPQRKPLAFATSIVVSLLWPEREAQARFVDLERQTHLGELAAAPRPRPAGAVAARAK